MLIAVAGKLFFFLTKKKENFADKVPQLPSNFGRHCGKSLFLNAKPILS